MSLIGSRLAVTMRQPKPVLITVVALITLVTPWVALADMSIVPSSQDQPTTQPEASPMTQPMTTASGLTIEILQAPQSQEHPKADSRVKVHYEGSLEDGTVFDSSYQRGEPVVFPLNQVIPGWTETVMLMSPGEKVRVRIPAALAYGERGIPGVIPQNSPLIFQIELLSIED